MTADGNALRVEPVVDDALESVGEWLVVPASGDLLTVEQVRELREADQR